VGASHEAIGEWLMRLTSINYIINWYKKNKDSVKSIV
jgi:hypothetical protein